MIDLILEIPPEFCYGVIESITDDTITITKESWAPGVWAGLNKIELEAREADRMVAGIIMVLGTNFETREVSYLGIHGSIAVGDQLYYHEGYLDERMKHD